MTFLSFPNLMMKYTANWASSTCIVSSASVMFLTSIFKHFGVNLVEEDVVEVKIMIKGC